MDMDPSMGGMGGMHSMMMQMMHQQQQMMNELVEGFMGPMMMGGFGFGGGGGFPMLEGPRGAGVGGGFPMIEDRPGAGGSLNRGSGAIISRPAGGPFFDDFIGMGMGGGNGGAIMFSSQQFFNSSDPSQNFSRSTTAQAGPSGVFEARTTVRDGREGIEQVGIHRQLGDRYTQVERTRKAGTGEETIKKTVHNVDNDDADRFDEEWRTHATRHLPLYRTSGGGGSDTHFLPPVPATSQPSPVYHHTGERPVYASTVQPASPVLAIADRPSTHSYVPTSTSTSTATAPSYYTSRPVEYATYNAPRYHATATGTAIPASAYYRSGAPTTSGRPSYYSSSYAPAGGRPVYPY